MSSKQQQQQEGQRNQTETPMSSPRSQAASETRTPRSQASSQRSSPSKNQHYTPRSRQSNSRVNKIYRTPPTPPPGELMTKEKSFVLDCNAVSSISGDYSKANPKLGPVIPPYNSQNDRHVGQYFSFLGVNRTLRKTGQLVNGTSIEGPYVDKFAEEGKGYLYLSRRNQNGAGHSRETIDGHAQFMQGIKPVIGYNGKYGYRRNNPWLRALPSPFGTASTSPTH